MKRENISKELRYDVLYSQYFKCAMCQTKLDYSNKHGDVVAHIDHIIPYSIKPDNSITNLQALCPSCNIKKHVKINYESLIKLIDQRIEEKIGKEK